MTRADTERTAPAVTVLHLADLRFGDCQRQPDGLTGPDRDHDSLAARLLDDLAHLREKHALIPDVVVVAGDLAERARPAEYETAHLFLTALASGLALGPERFVLVPGNHDVNRNKCHAYFLNWQDEDGDPEAPYWPKWEPFAAMYTRFTSRAFPRDQPWTYHEMSDLKVAVAGLNSTMADSHRDDDHYGWLGEEQLRYLARRAAEARRRGWLRLGVVHHNPVRGAGADDAHLRDADRFREILAPDLHVLFHGHTHDTRIDHLGDRALPVLCTGSVGVVADERPPGVPNQYQIVRITRDGLRICARRYNQGRRRWEGDTGISERGDDWRRVLPVGFQDIDAALPPPDPPRPRRPTP